MDKQNQRAFNFSAVEMETLISSVEKAKLMLFGKFSASLSHEDNDRERESVEH